MAKVPRERLRALLERATVMMRRNLGPHPRATTLADPAHGRPPAGLGRCWVYRRDGRPCPRCRTLILRVVRGADAGRSTYLCPACIA